MDISIFRGAKLRTFQIWCARKQHLFAVFVAILDVNQYFIRSDVPLIAILPVA